MRLYLLFITLTMGASIAAQASAGPTWQDLLDRADSLLAAGDLDSARWLVDEAISKTLSRPDTSGVEVEMNFYRKGVRESHYFTSYEEAESLYTRALSLRSLIAGVNSAGAADIEIDLAQIYRRLNRYEQAEDLLDHALSTHEAVLGAEHPQVGRSLRTRADFHLDVAEYGLAETAYQRSLLILEKAVGADHPDFALSLRSLGNLYLLQARYEEAETLLTRAVTIEEQTLGPEHPEVALSLTSLGRLYSELGRYKDAEARMRRALAHAELALGPNHPDVALILSSLAVPCFYQRKYQEVEQQTERALAILEGTPGPEHPYMVGTLVVLGGLDFTQGRQKEARERWERAIAIIEKGPGSEHPYVAICLANLANLYWWQGNHEEAALSWERALAIWEKTLGLEHPKAVMCLNGLANLYTEQGRYKEATPLLECALATWEKTVGPDHPDLALNLNNLANLYSRQGRYKQAEPLFWRAIEVKEKALGSDHPDIALALNNLANICTMLGRYEEAETLHLRALAIKEKALRPDHPKVASSLDNLAILYMMLGRYEEAETLHLRALAIREEALGPDHPETAGSLSNLATLCSRQGRYEEADSLFKLAIRSQEKVLGSEHPVTAAILEEAVDHHRRAGETEASLKAARRAFQIREANFRDVSTVMIESNALRYSRFKRDCADRFLSAYFDCRSHADTIVCWAADVVLSTKGLASEGVLIREAEMKMMSQPGTLLDSLRIARNLLAKLYVSGPGSRSIQTHKEALDKAFRDKKRHETRLARANVSFRNLQEALDVDSRRITDVLSTLADSTVLVEYMRYNYLPVGTDPPIPHYLALVIDRTGPRSVIDLGEAAEIDDLVQTYRQHMLEIASSGRRPDGKNRADYKTLARSLCGRIWEPIEDLVSESELIAVAPDAGLCMISFASLIGPDDRYLIERYRLHCLSSARNLARHRDEGSQGSGLLALGDPDYDAPAAVRALSPVESHLAMGSPSLLPGPTRSVHEDLSDLTVDRLPGTRMEVELVARSWEAATSEPLAVYLGSEASEERFKAEAPGKRVIHLATHGYFLEGESEHGLPYAADLRASMAPIEENPLLLSGLFLAGANLHGEVANSIGAEDGVLTAEEVSALNLMGVGLAVLSACETGLGTVRQGEGVYGLRRAFQMAGARTVISALWPVSDTATSEIMSQLYQRKDETLPDAMRRIQIGKIEELRGSNLPDHPFTWAGFIAVGDWR